MALDRMVLSGTGFFCGIENVIDTQKFLLFGYNNGVVNLRQFADSTYSALSSIYSITLADSKVQNTVSSNSYVIGVSFTTNPVLIKFTYDATTTTSEIGTDLVASSAVQFFGLQAITSTNYVLSSCTVSCSTLDAYKIRRTDSVTFGAPDILESSALLNTGQYGLRQKPGTNFVVGVYRALQVFDYTVLTASTILREKSFNNYIQGVEHVPAEPYYVGIKASSYVYMYSWVDDALVSTATMSHLNYYCRMIFMPGTNFLLIHNYQTHAYIFTHENGVLTVNWEYFQSASVVYTSGAMLLPGSEPLVFMASYQSYNNMKVISFCSRSCATCVGISNFTGQCTTCKSNFVAGPGSTCVCPPNYLTDTNFNCNQCTNSCKECETYTYRCTECYPSATLTGTNCLCPDGQYASGEDCFPCTFPCSKCINTATQCTDCPTGMYRSGSQCYCNTGTYLSGTDCLPCDDICYRCIDTPSKCTQCLTYFTLDNTTNTCSCTATGRYLSAPLVCTLCTSPCKNCSGSPTYCTECQAGVTLDTATNTCSCPAEQYLNGSTCYSCTQAASYFCKECTHYSVCTTCHPDFTLVGSTCTCPDGKYGSGTSCLDCDPECIKCSGSSTYCTACPPDRFVSGGNCYCNYGTYLSGTTCLPCNPPCSRCVDNADKCTLCLSNFTYNYNSTVNTCTCIPGKFLQDASTCVNCTSPCTECSGSATTCTACHASAIYDSVTNTCSCASGQLLSGYQCYDCTNYCKECQIYTYRCTDCHPDFTLSGTTCTCPATKYASVTSCLDCSWPCLNCSGTDTTCTTCPTGLYKSGSNCFCNNGTYMSGQSCLPCNDPCQRCVDNADKCTLCYSYFTYDNVANTCTCPTGRYLLTPTSCQACTSPCKECSGTATTCTDCYAPMTLNIADDMCYCPTEFYRSGNSCIACNEFCKECNNNSATQCTECKPEFLPLVGTTNQCDCPSGKFKYSGTCNDCQLPCLTCSSISTTCTSCYPGFSLSGSTCVCPAGEYASGASCLPCDYPCTTCHTTGSTCTSCGGIFIYQAGTNSCFCDPAQNYIIKAGDCIPCPHPCATCKLEALCVTCADKYTLMPNETCQCTEASGRYLAGSDCLPCDSKCSSCVGSSDFCLACTSNLDLELDTNKCSCKNLMNLVEVDGSCVCPLTCGHYTSQGTCLSCECAEKAAYANGACANCQCVLLSIEHQFSQFIENCPIEDICLTLEFSNAEDKAKDVGQLSLPTGKIELFEIVDSQNKTLNYTLINNGGGITLSFKAENAPENNYFLSTLTNQTLSVQSGDVYLSKMKPVKNTFKKSSIPQSQLKTAQATGDAVGAFSGLLGMGSEIMSVGATVFALDSSGVLVSFSQLIKTLTLFRFINIFYGDLLENFLSTLGKSLEKTSTISRNSYILNTVGSRGKFTKYDKPVSTIQPYLSKILMYLFSWIIKVWSKYEIFKAKKSGKINKIKFYVIWFHQKIHFGVFNMFITNGVMLTTRTILHVKMFPSDPFLLLDKFVAAFCFVLFTIDFMDLLTTTISFERKHSKRELTEIRERMDDAQKFLKQQLIKIQKENEQKNIFKGFKNDAKDSKKQDNKDDDDDLDSSIYGLTYTPEQNKKVSKFALRNEKILQRKKIQEEKEKQKKLAEEASQIDYKFDGYPTMIPKSWFTPEEAKTLGYSEGINYENAISKIEWNQPFIAFSISNVKKTKYDFQNFLSIRLDAPFMRLRMILYNVILASCSTIPVLAASLCFFVEFSYFIFVIYTVCRYWYQKNWLVILSRINVSISIVLINLIACYVALTQDRSPKGVKEVNFYLQIIVVFLVVVCIVFELLLLVITGLTAICALIWFKIQILRNKIAKTPTNPILGYVWTIPPKPYVAPPVVDTSQEVKIYAPKSRPEDPYYMPDSDAEGAELEVEQLYSRDVDNFNDMGAIIDQELGVPMKRFKAEIEDFSPIFTLVLNRWIDDDIKEEIKSEEIKKKQIENVFQ